MLIRRAIISISPTLGISEDEIFCQSLGNLWGSLAAVAFMLLVPEALRFVGLPSGIAANVRQVLYGAALILVIWLQVKGRGAVSASPERPV